MGRRLACPQQQMPAPLGQDIVKVEQRLGGGAWRIVDDHRLGVAEKHRHALRRKRRRIDKMRPGPSGEGVSEVLRAYDTYVR